MVAFVRGKLDSEKVEDRYKSLGLVGPLPYVENTNGRTFLDISYNTGSVNANCATLIENFKY